MLTCDFEKILKVALKYSNQLKVPHRPQEALRLLNGPITSEEAHQHHDSTHSYQDVDACTDTEAQCDSPAPPPGGSPTWCWDPTQHVPVARSNEAHLLFDMWVYL